MELLIGLAGLVLLVLWGAWGHWRYWRAVQAAAVERRLAGAQIETLWRQIGRDAWAGRVLDEVLQSMEGRTEC